MSSSTVGRKRRRPESSSVRLESAIAFLKAFKAEVPIVYGVLVACLNEFERTKNLPEMRDKVSALLAEYPQHLENFRDFLPFDDPVVRQTRGGTRDAPIEIDDSDAEDDVVITGQTGVNPLADVAHARHQCVVCPFPTDRTPDYAPRAQTYCPRCFCYLCDKPASECSFWHLHAVAGDDTLWTAIRQALREVRGTQDPVQNTTRRGTHR